MKNSDLFINESDYPDLDQKTAVEHLSGALKFNTVSYIDTSRIDYGAFNGLHEYLRREYPNISKHGKWQTNGHSLLIIIDGSDRSLRPALFMAHQDVVPIQPGTQDNWLRGPFSGDVSEGYIWGRGAMDIKQMLIAEMESVEYLLKRGAELKRTVMLAFGEDEETLSHGARAIVDELEKRGVTLEYVLDEGAGDVSDAADWGAPGTLICPIGIYEKGYGDLMLSVRSKGGHSSNPFHGTSLGHISDAISAVIHDPPEPRLSDSVKDSLRALEKNITDEPMLSWAKDIEGNKKELINWFMSKESLYHLISTTIAPTMIKGGAPSGNVMPQDMEAVINFRMIPQDTPEVLKEKYKELLGDDVGVEWVQAISASVPSDTDSYGYASLKAVLEHYFDKLVFIPAQNKGATDARWYERICRSVMRFGPFLEEETVSAEGVHGTNERISIRAYMQGIRVLIRLIEETCTGVKL